MATTFNGGLLNDDFQTGKKKATGDDDDDNLWSSILAEVQNSSKNKLPSNKNVLVLGDNESGKTTLIAKLQGVEDPKKGSGLEYAYIDVRDEYRDDQTRLSVWVLDGEPGHSNLLKFALNTERFPNTLVMLVAAMTTPWAILDQLKSWSRVLGEHIDLLSAETDSFKQVWKECRQQLVKKWQDYSEPGDDLDPGSPLRRTSRNLDDEPVDNLPLPDGVLTTNLGLDIVVVITKTDYMSTLEKEHDYRDEHFEFMQQWIRRFCLQYGAGLFYTSVKEDKNCDLLYKYLTHRIYSLPFKTPALVVEKDAVLVPAGWDIYKKISILHENLQSMKPDDDYRDVIVQPPSNKKNVQRQVEIVAEDEQAFLARQQEALMGLKDPSSRSPTTRNQASTGPVVQVASPNKKVDPKLAGSTPSGEGILANFFNSLLHKKSGGSPGGPGSPLSSASASPVKNDSATVDKAAMRNDAAAELDRITKTKKVPSADLETSTES